MADTERQADCSRIFGGDAPETAAIWTEFYAGGTVGNFTVVGARTSIEIGSRGRTRIARPLNDFNAFPGLTHKETHTLLEFREAGRFPLARVLAAWEKLPDRLKHAVAEIVESFIVGRGAAQ